MSFERNIQKMAVGSTVISFMIGRLVVVGFGELINSPLARMLAMPPVNLIPYYVMIGISRIMDPLKRLSVTQLLFYKDNGVILHFGCKNACQHQL